MEPSARDIPEHAHDPQSAPQSPSPPPPTGAAAPAPAKSGSLSVDRAAARALTKVIGTSKWEAVALAHAFLLLDGGGSEEEAARLLYNKGSQTLAKSRESVSSFKSAGFLSLIPPRERTGPAENAITKLFPATITEHRFLEAADDLHLNRPTITYHDEREAGHKYIDLTLTENDAELPINIKVASTRFEKAKQLVDLDPDDCVPIPAYKAHGAVEGFPNIVYVVAVDYSLIGRLARGLMPILDEHERIVWELLGRRGGSQLRNAEDAFVFSTVRKYWSALRDFAAEVPFHVISARKALRILQTKPGRTPGIGLRAWGTSSRGEVNVHLSIREDMTPWSVVSSRLVSGGILDIIQAVNRRRIEEVYDPEI
jgi:hypothetical protein